MKKIRRGIAFFLIVLMPVSMGLQSCETVEKILDIAYTVEQILAMTGWITPSKDQQNIPDDITPFDEDTKNLPARKSLEDKFPPIGDQGAYGTCVAWAVGYNVRTALNAIEKGWSAADLADPANQTSPKDLWAAIPTSDKGSSSNRCNGTNFEPAFDALIADGAASLAEVPYYTGNKDKCDAQKSGRGVNKLANYRKIASNTNSSSMTPENFKGYLNAGRPVAIGAKLGDNFKKWKSSSPISADTYKSVGEHAYHAMALVGYDDSKNAFRVRNSWGKTDWGDEGSIWVDYDFFCKSFCFAAFVAQNPNASSFASAGMVDGYDLLALSADDYDYVPDDDDDDDVEFTRTFEYEVFNSGTRDILPSQKWTVTLLYYNAKNANEYKVIFDDYYTNEFGAGDGYYEEAEDWSLVGGWWNNMTLKKGESVGSDYVINYVMPKINGDYYLVVMADSWDVISEVNEDNNFFFITAEGGKPLHYVNGVITNRTKSAIQRSSVNKQPALFSNTEHQTAVVPGNLNAYTPTEIKTMLLHDKKTGKLNSKIKAFRTENNYNKSFQKVPKKKLQ
jgi:hypothetical protein